MAEFVVAGQRGEPVRVGVRFRQHAARSAIRGDVRAIDAPAALDAGDPDQARAGADLGVHREIGDLRQHPRRVLREVGAGRAQPDGDEAGLLFEDAAQIDPVRGGQTGIAQNLQRAGAIEND